MENKIRLYCNEPIELFKVQTNGRWTAPAPVLNCGHCRARSLTENWIKLAPKPLLSSRHPTFYPLVLQEGLVHWKYLLDTRMGERNQWNATQIDHKYVLNQDIIQFCTNSIVSGQLTLRDIKLIQLKVKTAWCVDAANCCFGEIEDWWLTLLTIEMFTFSCWMASLDYWEGVNRKESPFKVLDLSIVQTTEELIEMIWPISITNSVYAALSKVTFCGCWDSRKSY